MTHHLMGKLQLTNRKQYTVPLPPFFYILQSLPSKEPSSCVIPSIFAFSSLPRHSFLFFTTEMICCMKTCCSDGFPPLQRKFLCLHCYMNEEITVECLKDGSLRQMKHRETPTMLKPMIPSRTRASSKPKEPSNPEPTRPRTHPPSAAKTAGRLPAAEKPKPGDGAVVPQKQCVRPRRAGGFREDGELMEQKKMNKDLKEKLEVSESLVKDLEAQVSVLKPELEKTRSLNQELESENRKLSENLAAAETSLASYARCDRREHERPNFKDIQKVIAHKLETPRIKNRPIDEPKVMKKPAPPCSTVVVKPERYSPASSSQPAPPPPPPPPLRPVATAATALKVTPPLQLFNAMTRANKPPVISSAHSSIVGEIQNRSAHQLAIKTDIDTKGEFINSLIKKINATAFTDIEDLVKFVDWFDAELSSLADERAVLKHFKWPERKADAMREAAVEYRELKSLENEISGHVDDPGIPCGAALKKMAVLLDKSERSIQRLIKLRTSVIRSYENHNIPTDWMLDSGMMYKIKRASMKLATAYIKRVATELQLARCMDNFSQETLLRQGMNFAHRAHQFAGELDTETVCAFEEMTRRVPGHLAGSKEMLATGILSS